MKLSERQKKNKEKTQQQLREIVSSYSASSRQTASAQHASVSRGTPAGGSVSSRPSSPGKPKKKRVTLARLLGLGSKNKKKTIKKASMQTPAPSQKTETPVPRKLSTTAQLRDTISDYRSRPMSKSKRRNRNILYYVLFAAVILAVFIISSLTVLFNISKITVTGNSGYSVDEIISASGIEKDKNMFRINLGKIEAAMESSMPYIKSVDIRRVLPDEICIDVIETEAVAAVPCDGYALIDADSKALERVDAIPAGAIEIIGAEVTLCEVGKPLSYASEDTAEIISSVCAALETAQLRDRVTALDVSKRYDIKFVCSRLITCLIGNMDNMETKLSIIKIALADNPADVKAIIDATDSQRGYYRPEY